MKKDAYYFPHFCNARHDRKLKRVQKELGVEGYGIFFMILEVLREQPDFKYPMEDLDLLADEFGTSEQKVNAVVCNYKLFNVDSEDNFTSDKMVLYLQPYIERSRKAQKAAKARWGAIKNNAQAMLEHSTSNAVAMQGKESKGKEKKKDIPDSLESGEQEFYITKKKRKLSGKRLETFKLFWSAFDFRKGKADAADSWYDIPELTDSLVEKICKVAKIESTNRGKIIESGSSPKWAQGWLSSRRWEDEISANKKTTSNECDLPEI